MWTAKLVSGTEQRDEHDVVRSPQQFSHVSYPQRGDGGMALPHVAHRHLPAAHAFSTTGTEPGHPRRVYGCQVLTSTLCMMPAQERQVLEDGQSITALQVAIVCKGKSPAAKNQATGLRGSPKGSEGPLHALEQLGDGLVEDSLQLAQHTLDLLDQLVCSPQAHASAWLQHTPQACRDVYHLTHKRDSSCRERPDRGNNLEHSCMAADRTLPAVTSADQRGADYGQKQHAWLNYQPWQDGLKA